MNAMIGLFIRISLVAAFLVGFSGFEAKGADYFPLHVGNRWTYSPSYGDKGDRVDTIMDTETVNGTLTYIWNRQEAPDDNYNEKRWLADDGSYLKIYKYWDNEGPLSSPVILSPPRNMLKLNPVVGDTWEFELDFDPVYVKVTYHVISTTDSLTVEAGSFNNCIRVQELYEITESGPTEYDYEETIYAPGVGPVIYRDYTENWTSITFSQELVSFSLSTGTGKTIPGIPLLLLDD